MPNIRDEILMDLSIDLAGVKQNMEGNSSFTDEILYIIAKILILAVQKYIQK